LGAGLLFTPAAPIGLGVFTASTVVGTITSLGDMILKKIRSNDLEYYMAEEYSCAQEYNQIVTKIREVS